MQRKYSFIRLTLSKLFAKSNNSNRAITICSLQNAKTIGITLAANSRQELHSFDSAITKLKAYGANVNILGYVPAKKPPDEFADSSIKLISDKELDFLLHPNTTEAKQFENSTFDLLIDINASEYYPMQKLIQASQAKLKIGRYADVSPFDIMLSIPSEQPAEYYIEQITLYLQQLN